MIYLLDTNAVGDLTRDDPAMIARLAALPPTDRTVTCIIVRGECLFGVERLPASRKRDELKQQLDRVLASAPCVLVSEEVSQQYATVKWSCRRKGVSLDENDLWIAATALVLGATLVSRDGDFRNVDGLRVEDWTI